ncbi:[acyl-carrier-protein] S-malonyltransferase [Microbacterium sp. SORGH_AS 888]|nr:[acyl-carrier-protein] S-malonyltransferase [Microbacterium sp. SORGH_AS_0888]
MFRSTVKALLAGPRLASILDAWLEGSQEAFTRSAYTQPLLVALGIASARSLASRGLYPSALLGHSAGEFSLAVFAGLIDDEATRVVLARRSEILDEGPSGSMRAVRSDSETITSLLREHGLRAWIAAENSPTQCLVSAELGVLEKLAEIAQARSILTVPAMSDMPFHSPLVKEKALQLEESLSTARLSSLRVPMVSGSTGSWVSDAQSEQANFWAEQLWRPVKFWSALDMLLNDDWIIVDLGPGTGLSAIAASHPKVRSGQSEVVSLMPTKGANSFTDWVEKIQYVQKNSL